MTTITPAPEAVKPPHAPAGPPPAPTLSDAREERLAAYRDRAKCWPSTAPDARFHTALDACRVATAEGGAA